MTISELAITGTGNASPSNSPSTSTMPACEASTSKALARRRLSCGPLRASPRVIDTTLKPCGTWWITWFRPHSWRATVSRLAPLSTPRRDATPWALAQASTSTTSLPARASEAPRLTSMDPLSSCGVADRKVTIRGRGGPASMRRRPSAWSKSKLAKVHLAQGIVAGGGHQHRQVAVGELVDVLLQAKGALDQFHRLGQVQVFRHALAVRDRKSTRLNSSHDVQHVTDRRRFVQLGHDGAGQAGALVGPYHFRQGFLGRRRIQAQQALHVGAGALQHGDLFGDHLAALADADRVAQHGVLVAQFLQGDAQVSLVLHGVHHHAQDLAVDA